MDQRRILAARFLLACLSALMLSGSTCKEASAQFSAKRNEVRYKQDNQTGFLYVPVVVAKRVLTLAVDTGCVRSAIDISHKDLFGPEAKRESIVDSAGRVKAISAYQLPSLSLFGVGAMELTIAEAELSGFRQLIGLPLDGFLGSDFLEGKSFGYDNAENAIYFGRSPKRTFAVEYDFELQAHSGPRVQGIQIDGIERGQRFVIDTGGLFEINLPTEVFDELCRQQKIHSLGNNKGYAYHGQYEGGSGRLANASIWGMDFSDIPVSAAHDFSIGLSLLRRFDFYIDYDAKRLRLNRLISTNTP